MIRTERVMYCDNCEDRFGEGYGETICIYMSDEKIDVELCHGCLEAIIRRGRKVE